MAYNFNPDWTISPGVMLKSYMEEMDCLVSDIVRITGFQEQDINYILAGEKRITPYISRKLAEVFQFKPMHFYRLQEQFDVDIAEGRKAIE